MAKKFDVVVGQSYTRNGEEKTKWLNIGAVIETERGLSLKLETVPLGWDGWAKLFEPKPREEQPKPANAVPQDTGAPFNDDIPF
jgi:hypothetical protein